MCLYIPPEIASEILSHAGMGGRVSALKVSKEWRGAGEDALRVRLGWYCDDALLAVRPYARIYLKEEGKKVKRTSSWCATTIYGGQIAVD